MNMFRNRRAGSGTQSKRLKDKSSKKRSKRSFLRRNDADDIMTPQHGEDHSTERDDSPQEKDPFLGRYKPVCYLGKGAYGAVVEAESLHENEHGLEKGMQVAVKNVRRIFHNHVEARRLLRELHILKTLKGHDCIATLLDIIPPEDFAEFLELPLVFTCADTDLKKILRSAQTFSSLHVEYIMYQILLGTRFMHTAGIAHRDLKPANILINADCTIQICDFGLARSVMEDIDADADEKSSADERLRKALGETDEDQKDTTDARSKKRKSMPKKKRLSKVMTKHVVTRWYRAPEVILIQQKRETVRGIDLWSIGCIFAELLQMQERYCTGYQDRSVLFPGRSCFPLSAKDSFAFKERTDQLNLIFDLIGTPAKEEIDKLDDGKSKEYLYSLPPKKGIPLTWKFPALPTGKEALKQYLAKNEKVSEAMDLLGKLLKFDVDSRITAEEALGHPYCSRVRAQEREYEMEPVQFEFESMRLNTKDIRKMLCEEIVLYNPDESHKLEKLRRS